MKTIKYILFFVLLSIPFVFSSAQLLLRKTWNGQYDIKMVGSMVLQPAFVSSTSPVTVTGFVTDEIQSRTNNLSENNEYNDFPSTRAIPSNVLAGLSITNPANTMLNGKTCPNGGLGDLIYTTINKTVALVYTDCDDNFDTFQSSAAYLDFGNNMACTEIKAAYLYWAGESRNMCTYGPYPGTATMKSYPGGAVGNKTSTYKTIKFKVPGDTDYRDITATRELITTGSARYICVADVTDIVKGKSGGLFWVANVQTTSRGADGVASGWNLVVLFTPPNCPPRMINLWDGMETGIGMKNMSKAIPLTNLVTPASKNFKSYMGLAVLDGENIATILDPTSTIRNIPVTKLDGTTVNIPSRIPFETLNFQSRKNKPSEPVVTGDLIRLNPFATDQLPYRFADRNGAPFIYRGGDPNSNDLVPTMQDACTYSTFENFQFVPGIDGISSSRITSYDEVTNTNGNEIRRLPSRKYTMGFDAHHFRLPSNALVEGATEVTMTMFSGAQGGTMPFMAYVAIETLQPRLLLYKSSLIQKTQLGQEIEYKLKVENVGGLVSESGAFIVDSLDIPLDFVPGSVQYLYGKTPPLPFEIINQGQDQNEVLKFYLPAIQPSNLQVVQDSVVITFKAKVKGLDRIDIWSVGCRRTIRNKATVYYASSDGDTFESGSNSGGGCPGEGQFADVKVDDQILEETINQSHNIEAVLTTRVDQNPNLKVVDVIREYLTAAVGQEQALLYIISSPEGYIISPSAVFDRNVPIQRYSASYDMGYECIEVYNFKFTVGKVPKVNAVTSNTSCVGFSDGKITISISEGEPGFSCKVVNTNDANVVYFNAYTPDAETTVQHDVCGLPAGSYTIIVGDKGELLVTENVTIANPLPLAVSITAPTQVCTGSNATLSTTVTGRAANVPLTYTWKKSTDNITWQTISTATTGILTEAITEDIYYQAFVCDNACQTSATKQVLASPIPVVSLYQDTTVSITINPTATFVAKVSNYTPPIGSYTWKMSTNNGVTWQTIPVTGALGTHTKVNDSTYTVSNITSLSMNGYKYQVSVTDAAPCSSATPSVATLTVVEGPAVTHTSVPTKCSNSSDGELHFTISAGETAQEYSISLYSGSGYSDTNQPSAGAVSTLSPNFVGGTTRTLDVLTIASGQYTLILRPVGGLPGLKNYYTSYTVTAPSAILATVSGNDMICTGSQVSLSSQVSGGTVGGTRSYIWQESPDGNSFTDISTEITPSLSATINNDVYYRLQTMVNGYCPTYSTALFVTALPVPVVETLVSDSGCYAFDLHNFHAVETSGISNYNLTLHYGLPSSATDNRFLIQTNNYLIKKDQKKPFRFGIQGLIWARMSVQDLCYGTGVTNIYIKDMEMCSPIIISKFFSPDGDGINDLFQIEGLQDYSNSEIYIYDRYGKLVFSGNAASITAPNGWDGTYLGHPLPSDDYWYTIKLMEVKNKVGNFSLKRRKE